MYNSVIFAPNELVQPEFMKKTTLLLAGLLWLAGAFAQEKKKDSLKAPKKDWRKLDLSNRPGDHILIQYGADTWMNRPDTIRQGGGLSRHFNLYFMLDKPFKTDPRFSLGLGVGVGSSNIFFDRMAFNLNGTTPQIPIRRLDSLPRFDKYKLTTVYAEIPVELRYFSQPDKPNKSFKAAIGLRVGTMLKAQTKGKGLEDGNGNALRDRNAVTKESGRRYMNGTRISATARVGLGNFSLHAAYQLTQTFRETQGPPVRPFSIGLTISGL